MSDQSSAHESVRGPLLASFAPPGVGVRVGFSPVNTSWPFPRAFDIYENGILVRSLGTSAWIPRGAIQSIRRGPGYVRIKWELGGGTCSATASNWFRIGRIKRALEDAGYVLEG
ncbi:hypothetical protein G3T36_02425 [Diaminobutyricibacter tongyongensis]|uniref:Uncharacterized protein n=1 Tax=Leifsonia tongyongensis TaxID=1268043 RepID=A0A6L9XTS9_9MICO|nr:hypothetical protein [Diaminobutyricibacter tongyongensis]NEN04716.1 hypothetical protein [Diaminobutyricibacter tongyongensis]